MSKKMDTPFKAIINGERELDVLAADADALDVVSDGENIFHVLKNNQSYRVEIESFSRETKTFSLKVNGNPTVVRVGDRYDQLIAKMGLDKPKTQKLNELKAPMPGLVLEISVSVGQSIEKGDKIAILEAMKMENVLRAVGEGTVKSIEVAQGQSVEKGQILVLFE